jgi:hypothetical protein
VPFQAAGASTFEGRCFVVSAGQSLHSDDVPADLLDMETVDLADRDGSQHDLDVAGHYAWPDVSELTVDRRRRREWRQLPRLTPGASDDVLRACIVGIR